jgi:hypothetical protein
VVSESDGVSLTLAHWCGKPAHGGGTSSRASAVGEGLAVECESELG